LRRGDVKKTGMRERVRKGGRERGRKGRTLKKRPPHLKRAFCMSPS